MTETAPWVVVLKFSTVPPVGPRGEAQTELTKASAPWMVIDWSWFGKQPAV
jgi:hypothetical protein